MFSGSIVAIVTPFKPRRPQQLDLKALGALIEDQIAHGTSGIVPCGTTGESATLTHDEHHRVIEFTVKTARGRLPVIAGTGSNSTAEAIALTRHAKQVGADAALLICPYYNRPTQEGLFLHFAAVARAVKIPIVLYNIPSRTGVNLLPPTVARLMEFNNIIGIKESSGSLAQVTDLARLCGDRLCILSGDDPLTLPMLAIGARGVISVAANIVPGDVSEMIRLAEKGDLAGARRLHLKLAPLVDALFIETNPAPVKTALGLLGRCAPEVRLPLCALQPASREKLAQALRAYGLL